MTKLEHIKTVYFLGIGGIGMSALARYFRLLGCSVSGYDKTPTPLTKEMENEGISIHYTPEPELVPENVDLVIYTPAVPSDHEEWATIRQLQVPVMKRAEVLGWISRESKTLAVAGTHGKTTTSAILAHIFQSFFGEVNAFVGGIMVNYDTNFLYGAHSPYFIVEADEFDRSFLQLTPYMAIINSVDADHLDIYGAHDSVISGFREFAQRVDPNGFLVVKHDLKPLFLGQYPHVLTFGLEAAADFYAKNIRVENGRFVFDFHHPNGVISGLSLQLPGRHNIENTIAASAIALQCGISPEGISTAIGSFKGVKRRFEVSGEFTHTIYVDDYAHHPTEIERVLEAGRELYPAKRLTVIFQPHLFTRTRDFEDDFAKVLSRFDEVVLLDIYPARELPIEGVSSEHLAQKIINPNKVVLHKEDVVNHIASHQWEVLFTLGAGDIDTLVEPIKEVLFA